MKKNIDICILLILIFILLIACNHDEGDKTLSAGEALIEQDPLKAVAYFDSIAQAGKGRDALFDLLSLKARDKAYVTHTSDSVIKEVLAYYEGHKDNPRYPEALYYAGRVYADIGDSPTALRYFQEAHSVLSDAKTKNNLLMACVTSQTGRLLERMRLYEEAIYYVKEAVKINLQMNDSLNLLYNTRLLGEMYLNAHNYDKARIEFDKGSELAKQICYPEYLFCKMCIASILTYGGQRDSSLNIIRDVLKEVKDEYRIPAIVRASEIYMWAGIMDTAYLYSQEIIHTPNHPYHTIGYAWLLDSELRDYVPIDSIRVYADRYAKLLDKKMNYNQAELNITQTAYFNYTLQEKAKAVAIHRNNILQNWLTGIIILVLVLMIIILIQKNHNTHIKLELMDTIKAIDQLKQQITQTQDYRVVDPDNNRDNLRLLLRNKLYDLQNNKDIPVTLPEFIAKSDTYITLREYIDQEKPLEEEDKLWDELAEKVLHISPEFRKRLELLTGDNLTTTDWHMALLIKCGLTPTEMGKLVGRTKGTISGRRATLCQKVFDDKKGVHVIDNIIRLL